MTDFDAARFLRDHWQQRPLLIRNPWARWRNPLEPDELAGLACEAGVESRLIIRGDDGLVLEHGPLPEDRFDDLGAGPWTLLVQAVDHHVPDVAALIAPFRFVPDWRIDDVMVSYATDGGGVGPHFDRYDVFLVQGLGRRRWRVGPVCDATTPLVPHDDLRLIPDFEAAEEWVLDPGDILYIPPGYAHDGVGMVGDDCMTYSVGFRAPSRAELIEGWAAHQADGLAEDDRYADPGLAMQANPGEIAPAALDRLQAMVLETLSDREGFARWFGRHHSQPRHAETDWRPEAPIGAETVRAMLAAGAGLRRNPASRYAFVRRGADSLWLFVDGEEFDCTGDAADFAARLCARSMLETGVERAGSPEIVALVETLIDRGCLAFDEDGDDDGGDDDGEG